MACLWQEDPLPRCTLSHGKAVFNAEAQMAKKKLHRGITKFNKLNRALSTWKQHFLFLELQSQKAFLRAL
jgi:hypothetical protein